MKGVGFTIARHRCFSRSPSRVNTDKLCCIGHAASSEKTCFLSELRLTWVDVSEMILDESIWLIWCQVSSGV